MTEIRLPECAREWCATPVKTRYAKYCSLKCANAIPHRKITYIEKTCARADCSLPFTVPLVEKAKVYCSRSCAATVNNKKRAKYAKLAKESRKCKNPNCDVEFSAVKTNKREYCQKECKWTHNGERWDSGEDIAGRTYTLAEWAKWWVVKQANYQCEAIDHRTGKRCIENRFKQDGHTVLEVDHIDGNWRNNSRSNTRAICPTCHRLTPNWGAKNMGNGRTWKKDYNQYSPKSKPELPSGTAPDSSLWKSDVLTSGPRKPV